MAIFKIFMTSFSIGSEGSEGVFGLSIVISVAQEGVVFQLLHLIMPDIVVNPGDFVIVGMRS